MSNSFFQVNLLIIVIFGYLITDTLTHWERYKKCHSPIQLFLLSTYCLIILHRSMIIFKRLLLYSPSIKKCLTIFIYAIIQPFFVYLTVQGMIWQDLNFTYTPNCVPNEELPFLIWGWISLLIALDCIFLYVTICKIFDWWKVRTLERRMHRLVDQLIIIDEQTLRQLLLENTTNDLLSHENNRGTGISSYERILIPKVLYKKLSSVNTRDGMDICPICCEEFQEDVEVKCLPLCHHIFHSSCIDEWLKMNCLCPMCRASVKVNLNKVDNQGINLYLEECRHVEDLERGS